MPDDNDRPTKGILDLSLLAVRERLATNRIKWELLVLFGRNADQSFTPAQAAFLVHRSLKAVAVELQDLCLLGAIVPGSANGELRYRLTHEPLTRERIIRFAVTCVGAPPPRRRFAT